MRKHYRISTIGEVPNLKSILQDTALFLSFSGIRMIWNNVWRSGGLYHLSFKFKLFGKAVRKSESMKLILQIPSNVVANSCLWGCGICGKRLFTGSSKDSCRQKLCQLLSYNGVQDSLRRKFYCLKSVNPRTQRFLWRRNVLAYSYLPWLMDGPFPIFPANDTFSSSCSKKSLSDPSLMHYHLALASDTIIASHSLWYMSSL